MGSDMEQCFNVRTFFSTVYPFRSFLNRLIAANFLIRLTIKSQAHKEVNEKYFRPAPPPLTNSRQMRNLLAARAKEGIANKAQHRPRPTSIAFGCFGLSRVRCAGSAVMRGWLRLRRE